MTRADGGIIPAGSLIPWVKENGTVCLVPKSSLTDYLFRLDTKTQEKCNDACIIEGCDHCVFEKEDDERQTRV